MGSKNARGLNPETIDMLKNNTTLNQYDLNRLIVNNMHMGFHPNQANRFMAPPVNTTAGPNMPYPPKPPRQSGEQNIIMPGSLAGSRMSLMGHSHDLASKNHMNYQTHMKYESTGSLSQMYENTSTSKTSNTYVSKKEPPVSSQPTSQSQPSKSTLLQELLECPICMNLYDNPHVLPCQHAFCKKCIVSLQNTSTNNGNNATIDCPICREKHTLLNGVESLTANYTMKRLIELDAIQVASEKEKEKLITASVLKETSSSERDRQLPKEVVKPIKAKCFSCQKFAYLGVCPHCSYTLCFECTQNPDHDIIIESKINAKKYLYPHKQMRSSFRMPRHESTCYRPATEYSIRRDVYANVSKMNHGGHQNINSSSNHPPMSPTIREHSPQDKYDDARLSMPHQHQHQQNSQQSQATNSSQQQQQQKLKLILLCHSSAVECSLEDENNSDRNSDKDEIYQDEYGKCSTFSKVNISPMDRVVTLKKLIESRFGIACDDQILVYKDKILNNDFKVLSHYKLRQFSRIHIFDERDIKESDGNEDDSLFGVYQQSNFNQNNSERKSSSKQPKNRSLKIEEIGEEKTISSHSDSFSGSASFQNEEANNSEQKQQQRSRMSSRFMNSSKSGGQKQPIQRVLSQQPPLADSRRSPAFNYSATGGSTMSRSVNYYSTKRYRKLDEIFDRQLSLNTSSTLTNY